MRQRHQFGHRYEPLSRPGATPALPAVKVATLGRVELVLPWAWPMHWHRGLGALDGRLLLDLAGGLPCPTAALVIDWAAPGPPYSPNGRPAR